MKVIYDSDTDTLTVVFRDEPVAESDELDDDIIVDYGRDGRLISLEVLAASEHVAEPQAIAYEMKGRRVA